MNIMVKILILGLLVGCNHSGLYNVGDCTWHISDSPDSYRIDEIRAKITVDDEDLYISKRVDLAIKYEVDLYASMSVSYYDLQHPRFSREARCGNLNKEAEQRCLKNPKYMFLNGSVKCPKNKEEFKKTIKYLQEINGKLGQK